MKVSVLTPTYNDGISIKETVQSLISQTHTDWEWIVINDGSTDDTDEIMQEIISEYHLEHKCIYLKQENADQLNAILNGCNYITGDYVFILHSDDLLPSDTFFAQCIDELNKDASVGGLFGDLQIINEKSEMAGMQSVNAYNMCESIPPLMLLWLGRNIYADVAFHKTEFFVNQIKENYLTWNMPFWLYYEEQPKMLPYKKADFPVLKYRVHSGNYINSEVGLHNVLNGEIRTAIKLMHYYEIPNYEKQYVKYRMFNKLGLVKLFHVKYKSKETENKADIIDYIIKKRFEVYKDNVFFNAVYMFYKNKKKRTIDMSCFPKETRIYCGKDVRAFNKALLGNTLDEKYLWFMREMCEGFDQIINYKHLGEDKVSDILQFFCIEKEVKL